MLKKNTKLGYIESCLCSSMMGHMHACIHACMYVCIHTNYQYIHFTHHSILQIFNALVQLKHGLLVKRHIYIQLVCIDITLLFAKPIIYIQLTYIDKSRTSSHNLHIHTTHMHRHISYYLSTCDLTYTYDLHI